MDDTEIRRTWRKLIVPFIMGLIILIVAIIFHRFGSKRPGPQALWFFVAVLGAVFTAFPGFQMLRFRQHLKNRNKGDGMDS